MAFGGWETEAGPKAEEGIEEGAGWDARDGCGLQECPGLRVPGLEWLLIR